MDLLQTEDAADLLDLHPPITDEDMDEYIRGRGSLVCTPDDFHIDFILESFQPQF